MKFTDVKNYRHIGLREHAVFTYFISSNTLDLGVRKLRLGLYILIKIIGLIFAGSISKPTSSTTSENNENQVMEFQPYMDRQCNCQIYTDSAKITLQAYSRKKLLKNMNMSFKIERYFKK